VGQTFDEFLFDARINFGLWVFNWELYETDV